MDGALCENSYLSHREISHNHDSLVAGDRESGGEMEMKHTRIRMIALFPS